MLMSKTEMPAKVLAGGPPHAMKDGLLNPRSAVCARAIEDFLIAIHFGKKNLLTRCIGLAYRDLQRTVRGISKYDKTGIPERVRALVADARRLRTQEEFDTWHQLACGQIIGAFRDIGFQRFTVGHAQKWLNMTLKYLFVLGDRVPGYEHVFAFCHVPLDKFVIAMATPQGLPQLPGTGAWSTLNDYSIYMECQRWFRARFAEPPLVVEFRLWLDHISQAAADRPMT
jgi:hypothetical protein